MNKSLRSILTCYQHIVFLGKVIDVEQRDISFTLGTKRLRPVITFKITERFKGLGVFTDEVKVVSRHPSEEIKTGEIGLVAAHLHRDFKLYFALEIAGPSRICYNYYSPNVLTKPRLIFSDQETLEIARKLKRQRFVKELALFVLSLSLVCFAYLHYSMRQKRQ